MGLNSSGFRPADASSPIAPEICESTIQKSPCSVDSTRGARSRSAAGAAFTHRSFGGFSWESAEMMRSFGIDRSPLVLEVLTDRGDAVQPGRRTGYGVALAFTVARASVAPFAAAPISAPRSA